MSLRETLRKWFEPAVVEKTGRFIHLAQDFGLPQIDVRNAEEMMEANECGEAFDTVVAQMYEYDIPATDEFLRLAKEIMADMQIDEKEYWYLADLPKKDHSE
jgi:hypothetical protein